MRKQWIAVGILALIIAFLNACSGSEKAEDGLTVTPTQVTEPTDLATPTATPLPTDTPTPTPSPLPTPIPSERSISVDELRNREVIFNDYFGMLEDVDREMEKRKEYLSSFGVLSDNEMDIILAFLNLCYLRSDDVNQDVASKYYAICNEDTLNATLDIADKIMKYNYENPEKQIVIGWLGIDDALGEKDRMVLHSIQYNACKMIQKDISYRTNLDMSFPLRFYVFEYDGESKQEAVKLDELNSVCKYFMICFPFRTLERLQKESEWYSFINVRNDMRDIQPRLLNIERIRHEVMGFSNIEWDEIRR